MKWRRAVSAIVAEVLLIMIVIAGGIVVYSIFFSGSNSTASVDQMVITSLSLSVPTSSQAGTVTVTVKNTGNVPAEAIIAYIMIDGSPVQAGPAQSLNLRPGMSTSFSGNVSPIVDGNMYTVKVTTQFTDGGSTTVIQSVTATG